MKKEVAHPDNGQKVRDGLNSRLILDQEMSRQGVDGKNPAKIGANQDNHMLWKNQLEAVGKDNVRIGVNHHSRPSNGNNQPIEDGEILKLEMLAGQISVQGCQHSPSHHHQQQHDQLCNHHQVWQISPGFRFLDFWPFFHCKPKCDQNWICLTKFVQATPHLVDWQISPEGFF